MTDAELRIPLPIMYRSFFPTTGGGLFLVALLSAGGLWVHAFADQLAEPRRFLLALVAFGLFGAPRSAVPMPVPSWLVLVALVGWTARLAALQDPSVPVVAFLSLAGACLAVRAGERFSRFYLPEAGSEEGISHRRSIRRDLRFAVAFLLAAFLLDGFFSGEDSSPARQVTALRLLLLFASAVAFVRYLLKQTQFLGLPGTSLLDPTRGPGIVAAQRWPFLLFLLLVGWSPLPGWLLRTLGEESASRLLVTTVFLWLLASMVFVSGLIRLERRQGWPRSSIRLASFLAGIFLAHALASILVAWARRGGSAPDILLDRSAEGIEAVHYFIVTFFLIVLPFLHERTRLLGNNPKWIFFVPPTYLAVMSAPLVAVNGGKWSWVSTGFLFFTTLLILSYHLLSALRTGGLGKPYLITVLLLVATGLPRGLFEAQDSQELYKTFLFAAAFVLYAVDVVERAGRGKWKLVGQAPAQE